jgi:hypothetical protein
MAAQQRGPTRPIHFTDAWRICLMMRDRELKRRVQGAMFRDGARTAAKTIFAYRGLTKS